MVISKLEMYDVNILTIIHSQKMILFVRLRHKMSINPNAVVMLVNTPMEALDGGRVQVRKETQRI